MSRATPLAALLRDPLAITKVQADSAWKDFSVLFTQLLKESMQRFDRIIAQDPARATFDSVVLALLDMDTDLTVLWGLLNSRHGTHRTETSKKLIEKHEPQIVAYHNTIAMNETVYRLARAVKKRGKLSVMQKRSLHLFLRSMEMSGVHLQGAQKKRLQAINTESAKIKTAFEHNMTESRNAFFHVVTDASILREAPAAELEKAALAAKKRKMKGWVFTLSPPSYIVIMKYCSDRTLRKKFFDANCSVATSGAHDNRPLIVKLLKLRQEKARLLGHRRYADYILQDRMAQKPEAALKVLKEYAAKARVQAKKEVTRLKNYAKVSDLQWWDIGYEARKMREALFQLRDEDLQQYFPLPAMVEGMFAVAKTLFGVEMKPLTTGDTSVQAYNVLRRGKHIGTFILDPYARTQKRDGAWCDSLREPVGAPGAKREYAVAFNASNAPEPSRNKPSLLRHGDVQTIFHEFGHALHLLLSDTPYRNLHSFHTEWDFVELPSQLYENWCWDEKVLRQCARHYRTHEPIPHAMVEQLNKSKVFLQAINSMAQVEFGMLDMTLHTSRPPKTVKQLDALAATVSKRFGLLAGGAVSKRYASFHHLFGGGYAAGYYSYLWADILQADVFSIFEKHGILNPATGEKYRREILAAGTSRPAGESFRAFVGRGPDPNALLRLQGLL